MPNCDICSTYGCVVCKINYQLKSGQCVACTETEGYDPISKECFSGISLNEFIDTQFGNLKSAATNVELLNNYFLATFRFSINTSAYSHNGFALFSNNIENYNRMIDFCWDSDCLNNTQSLYFALGNAKQSINIERFIVGTTSLYAIIPKSIIFGLKTSDMIPKDSTKFKNFDCSLFGNMFYQPIDHYYGKCTNDCQSGFFKDTNLQRCVKCNDKCGTCSSSTSCSNCKSKYVLISGECLSCQAPCVNCELSPHRCTSCLANTMFNSNSFSCDRYCTSKTGCSKCDFNSGKCFACIDGFELIDSDCYPKNCGLNNCSLCSLDKIKCKICEIGYELSTDQCIVCTKNCTVCPSGFALMDESCLSVAKTTRLLNLACWLLYILYMLI